MNDSHKHDAEREQPDIKTDTVWFIYVTFQKQVRLTYGVRSQDGRKVMTGGRTWGLPKCC